MMTFSRQTKKLSLFKKRCPQKLSLVLLLSGSVLISPLGALEQSKTQTKSDTKNLKETPSSIGSFTLPRSNHRFWFYMDNLGRQLEAILKSEQRDSQQASSIELLLKEVVEVKKSRVTYREVRDYLEINHKVLSELGVVDPRENGFKEN